MTIAFSSIQASSRSLWRPAHRLHKLPLSGRAAPEFGFHEIPEREWETPEARGIDPILDVVVRNDGERSVVVGALGLVVLDEWTDLKGLVLSEPIPLQVGLVLALERVPLNEVQKQALPAPRSLPANGGLLGVQLTLQGFRALLGGNNESLVQLTADVDGASVRSQQFYMGRY